ncbi:MAG: amidohydrolase [Armatimonadaceae bacterium]
MLYADLIAVHGNLMTLDGRKPRAEALAVRDEKLVFVGESAGAEALAGPQTVCVDLAGKTVVPGFIDSHLHLVWFGTGLLRHADLLGASSVDDVLARMADHAAQFDGEWLQGRGFDQDKLTEKRFPTRTELDKVSPSRPMVITRVCGHAVVVNSAALERLSEEERRAGDAETGLYTETAISAFYRRIPKISETEMEDAVLRAASVALQTGITSIGTLLDTPEQMGAYARLRRKGKLPFRVTGMPPYSSIQGLWERGVNTTFGDEWLRFGGAKFFSDGSLGARTALMSAPYADEDNPANLGIRIYDPEDLKAKCADAQAKGFQLVIHAIGDQAVVESLDAIEYALGPDGDNTFHRHRIEHASLLRPDQLERMAKRKIVAVVQPQFVTSDIWSGERVGPERASWAYPFQSMRQAGIPLALSSDCPVEKLDAFACLSAAVVRHPWSPDEKLTVEEALEAYSLGSAYALHAEDRVGSLEVGKLADFVVLSDDPTRISPADIVHLKTEQVYIGGVRMDSP